ncbi:NIPSNAP family protein [Sphingomonas sp. LB-2]|uniref:NIPSNAP family protein n=1 Tax=Sphingomonas caeni TaxID=2984949 RepID=UPI0022314C0D|nr:NIPSNAP family protein [Sphingomonas caeni]MCW3846749.1 NIPSNAP family protein [Sphingomonas caeni]
MRRRTLLGAIGSAALLPSAARGGAVEPQVIELRQYTLFGGRRDTLIDLFERHFIESQAAVGAPVLGTFRDLDDPDRFVWLRGFADMGARKTALETFYGGPIWKANSKAANATMLDSGNVLLLRPRPAPWRAPPGSAGLYTATIHDLGGADPEAFAGFFEAVMRPRLEALGARPFGSCVSETAPNDFPRLPVRGDSVFVWFARWKGKAEEAGFADRWRAETGWRDHAGEALLPALMRKPERLRLAPTARSPLR